MTQRWQIWRRDRHAGLAGRWEIFGEMHERQGQALTAVSDAELRGDPNQWEWLILPEGEWPKSDRRAEGRDGRRARF